MGFNYGTRHLSGQQQAIIKQREKKDEILKQESEKQDEIICRPIKNNGDYKAVIFEQGDKIILELRVSGTAINNQPCGLDEKTIHHWLEEVGFVNIKKEQQSEKVLITSGDVENGKLKTDWKNLNRVND